jgi:hypothetical protein
MPILMARSDSGLTAAGRHCSEARFWWYLEWPKPIQDCTLHHVKARNDPLLVSINSLEYSVKLITIESKDSWDYPHPVYLLEWDNTTGKSWLTKGCTSSVTGRSLARLQAALLLDQGVGYHFGRIDTKSNLIADGLSCIPSESSLSLTNSLCSSHMPPACLAVRASSRMLPSSHRLWKTYCKPVAQILSLQAGSY